jgi:hypothetical protein
MCSCCTAGLEHIEEGQRIDDFISGFVPGGKKRRPVYHRAAPPPAETKQGASDQPPIFAGGAPPILPEQGGELELLSPP